MPTQDDIPIIDLERPVDAGDIRKAFGHFGLAYVRHHGVDMANVSAVFDRFLSFCRRPHAAKAPLGRGDLWFQRGWTPPNTEKAVAAGGQPDFKECYFAAPLPLDPVATEQYPELMCPNVWPEGGPDLDAADFQARYLQLGRELHAAGLALLALVARAFELPEDTFATRVDGGAHVTRVLNYLPLTPAQVGSGILWGEEHTDFNLLTLLPGGRFYDPAGQPCPRPDDRSGLYLRTRAGDLVRGVAPEGCITAQVGQQLETLTGGTLVATPHVITAPATPGYSRASSAHFVHMHPNQVLYPLERFATKEAIARYRPPVLAGTYGLKTLVDIGLAPPSALAMLGYRGGGVAG